METALESLLVYAAWVSHRATGASAVEADRDVGGSFGLSEATVRRRRKRARKLLDKWPGLGYKRQSLEDSLINT